MTFFFHKPWQLVWDGFLYPDKLMEETEELSHQRAQREVRTLFTPLFFNHMTATAKMDFWLNNTHLTHMALKQLYLCVCAGAGASESGPGGGEDEVWGGGAGAEGRAGAYQTVKTIPTIPRFCFYWRWSNCTSPLLNVMLFPVVCRRQRPGRYGSVPERCWEWERGAEQLNRLAAEIHWGEKINGCEAVCHSASVTRICYRRAGARLTSRYNRWCHQLCKETKLT